MNNINGGNKKMKKIFSNENIRNIRLYVNHEIMNQGGKDKKDMRCSQCAGVFPCGRHTNQRYHHRLHTTYL